MTTRKLSLLCVVVLILSVVTGCFRPGDPLVRSGDEIMAAGQLFHTGTPVVLWVDPPNYDAYRGMRHFDPREFFPSNPVSKGNPNRYSTRRGLSDELAQRIDDQGWTLENLQQIVDQFVIHYDVCGTSLRCFKILHDMRGLSVQFLLDVDGTIYQTLDLKERAWHAGTANDRSVGVEIAHIGTYADMETLNQWYAIDDAGWPYVTLPDWMTETGIRTPNFVARSARKELIKGEINGQQLMQYDFTNEQYEALTKLTAALARVFPKMKLDVPRDVDGNLRKDVLSAEEQDAYSGLLAHWHVIKSKIDPGPAFDWERVLGGARRQLKIGL